MVVNADRPMINISKVSEWLTRNANEYIYPRLFLMSPNGTLLAYSKPVDIKELRDQAALISIVWKENCSGRHKPSSHTESPQDPSLRPALKTLTIETEKCNIIVRLLQTELILVLVGTIPPKKQQQFRIVPEGCDDPRYPEIDTSLLRSSSSSKFCPTDMLNDRPASSTGESDAKRKAPSTRSHMSQRERDIRVGTLHVQRKKLDALADYILKDLEDAGFIMPADSDLQ